MELLLNLGETFSFCDTVGKATPEDGYQKADIFDKDGNVTKGYGGGNCQISSTLYNAVLKIPSLTVIERHEHSSDVYYVPEGQDAAVSYGSVDFKFRNDNSYLISWEKSKVDLPIYDIYNLYRKYYKLTDFDVLLNNYQKRYPLKEEEIKLLFIKISIPFKIEFTKDEFSNTKKVKDLLEYLTRGDKLIRPYYKKVNS